MSMLYCKFCRAYTPSGGDRCSVCGMNYLYREDLGLKVKQVRPYLESAVEPIRIRPVKGRTIEFKDARYSEPFYAKVTDPRSYESEYLIMDRPTLDSVIGEMVPLSKGIGRQSGTVGGHRVDVAFTNDADKIASLNTKPKKVRDKGYCPFCGNNVKASHIGGRPCCPDCGSSLMPPVSRRGGR